MRKSPAVILISAGVMLSIVGVACYFAMEAGPRPPGPEWPGEDEGRATKAASPSSPDGRAPITHPHRTPLTDYVEPDSVPVCEHSTAWHRKQALDAATYKWVFDRGVWRRRLVEPERPRVYSTMEPKERSLPHPAPPKDPLPPELQPLLMQMRTLVLADDYEGGDRIRLEILSHLEDEQDDLRASDVNDAFRDAVLLRSARQLARSHGLPPTPDPVPHERFERFAIPFRLRRSSRSFREPPWRSTESRSPEIDFGVSSLIWSALPRTTERCS